MFGRFASRSVRARYSFLQLQLPSASAGISHPLKPKAVGATQEVPDRKWKALSNHVSPLLLTHFMRGSTIGTYLFIQRWSDLKWWARANASQVGQSPVSRQNRALDSHLNLRPPPLLRFSRPSHSDRRTALARLFLQSFVVWNVFVSVCPWLFASLIVHLPHQFTKHL
jgi:hypothetical protein